MMTMTFEEIRKRLGFVPQREYLRSKELKECRKRGLHYIGKRPDKQDVVGRLAWDRELQFVMRRRTGRTTYMLCSALVLVSKGHAITVGREGNVPYTRLLREQMRDYCVVLGLDPSLVRSRVISGVPEVSCRFYDHD